MSTAEFARAEGYEEGFTEGHREASLDGFTEGHHRGLILGLQAALAMAKVQSPTENWLGQVALDTFAANLRERIAAGGCPDMKAAS